MRWPLNEITFSYFDGRDLCVLAATCRELRDECTRLGGDVLVLHESRFFKARGLLVDVVANTGLLLMDVRGEKFVVEPKCASAFHELEVWCSCHVTDSAIVWNGDPKLAGAVRQWFLKTNCPVDGPLQLACWSEKWTSVDTSAKGWVCEYLSWLCKKVATECSTIKN